MEEAEKYLQWDEISWGLGQYLVPTGLREALVQYFQQEGTLAPRQTQVPNSLDMGPTRILRTSK